MCGCRQANSGHGTISGVASSGGSQVAVHPSLRLEYRGARALLIRGPATGAGYACYPGETLPVHAPDAPHLLASDAFVRTA